MHCSASLEPCSLCTTGMITCGEGGGASGAGGGIRVTSGSRGSFRCVASRFRSVAATRRRWQKTSVSFPPTTAPRAAPRRTRPLLSWRSRRARSPASRTTKGSASWTAGRCRRPCRRTRTMLQVSGVRAVAGGGDSGATPGPARGVESGCPQLPPLPSASWQLCLFVLLGPFSPSWSGPEVFPLI